MATLGDKFLTNLLRYLDDPNYHIYTTYEYAFPKAETSLGPRNYIADVYFDLEHHVNLWDTEHFVMAVELDGKKGHSSKYNQAKDKLRDYTIFEKFKCYTIRFQTYDIAGHKFRKGRKKEVKPITDIEILSEMNMTKLMKIPLPDSKVWSEHIHRCLHDSIIDASDS